MKTRFYSANDRGSAQEAWLKTSFSFSFADYFDPNRMGFGALRVLNDDIILPSAGFDMHPHANMEIVSVPTKGALRHRDNQGNEGVIRAGEIQIMSAGSGILHSEYNDSSEQNAELFQIWIHPKEKDINPRYDQKMFPEEGRKNRFQLLVSPDGAKDSKTAERDVALWINQDAYLSIAEFEGGIDSNYQLHRDGNGAYIFVIDGELEIEGHHLRTRDALGLSEIGDGAEIPIRTKVFSAVLAIEVPMTGSEA